jgi:hypothetical protein
LVAPSGLFNGLLVISGAVKRDAANYTCRVSSACGEARSLAATLRSCTADFDNGFGSGTCDGGVGVEDLLYFTSIFQDGNPAADVDDGTATGTLDGGVTIDDLVYFLARFEFGC